MSFVDAIGVSSGLLTIISFFGGGLPEDPGPQGATVRVHAGLGASDSQSMGGDIYQIFGYDNYNNFLGQTEDVSKLHTIRSTN